MFWGLGFRSFGCGFGSLSVLRCTGSCTGRSTNILFQRVSSCLINVQHSLCNAFGVRSCRSVISPRIA